MNKTSAPRELKTVLAMPYSIPDFPETSMDELTRIGAEQARIGEECAQAMEAARVAYDRAVQRARNNAQRALNQLHAPYETK